VDIAPALTLRGVGKSFPGVRALQGIDLDVLPGEVHALLGENGAGKSTLMKILAGIYRPDEGEIGIGGQVRHFTGIRDAAAAGVGIVFQEFSLVPDLNAAENIFLGRELRRFGLLDRSAMRRAAAALFARLGVRIDPAAAIRRLSVAQQQFVEIAKALALDARILILDEPTATLTPTDAGHLFAVMRALRDQGVAVIFISHHLEEIFEVCDHITVLRDGRKVGETTVADTDMERLVQMMVGRAVEQNFPPRPTAAPGAMVLEVDALQIERDGPVNAFHLRAGEILGFAGLVGSGRTETVLALLGADRCHAKTVRVQGRSARLSDPADALRLGIGILPESRKTEGLITPFSIRDNISINNLAKYPQLGVLIDHGRERAATDAIMRQVGVKAPDQATVVETLSGGNQQKVVLARWLNHHCRILFFDEPTRGIDVGAKAEIYGLMRALTAQGYAIVMVSSELPEIVGLCDRVAVFSEGRIVRTLDHHEITPETVMRHAAAGAQHEHA
jgi:ribose transport system ATP-binding protein